MPVTIACPNCDTRLEAPDDIEGKKVQCKECGEKFRARPFEEDDDRPTRRAAKSAGKSRGRPVDNEEEDERPSRRNGKASRRREEDDEDERDEDEDRARRRSRDEGDEEDEPRARKKRKKKKRALSPVVLLILIGVGVLLLIGAIGAYISLSGDKSDGGVAPGGPVSGPGGSGGAGGGAAADSAVPGWVEFDDPNGQFKVRLPRKPVAAKQPWPLPNGEQGEASIYSVEIGGAYWAVTHVSMPGREPGAPADPVLDELITGGMGWFKGAVIKSKTNITHQGFPGRQAVVEYPGAKGSTVLRVILAGNRMFWMAARGDNFAADTPKVRGFFESLKIN